MFFFRKEHFGGIVIDKIKGDEIWVDSEAFALLSDNSINIKNIKAEKLDFYLTVIKLFNNIKLNSRELRFLKTIKYEPLTFPLIIRWEITSECNLNCKYCYNDFNESRELSFSQICKLIKKFGDLKVFQIRFGGGEPFIRKDFIDILLKTKENGIIPSVVTNATLLSDKIIKKLVDMNITHISVSLDSFTALINDWICGKKGSFGRIIKNIEKLIKYGIKVDIQVVLNKFILDSLKDFVVFLINLGVYSVNFKFPIYTKSLDQPFQFSIIDKQSLIVDIKALRIIYNNKIFINNINQLFFSSSLQKETTEKVIPCMAGYRTFTILPNGRVTPCAYLQNEEWTSLIISSDNALKIWRDSRIFYPFRNLKTFQLELCKSCKHLNNSCYSGCRAQAFLANNSFYAHDPSCKKSLSEFERANSIRIFLSKFKMSEKYIWRLIDDNVVLYNPSIDQYLKLNKDASLIIQLLANLNNIKNITSICDSYNLSLSKIEKIINSLFNLNIVEENEELKRLS